VKLLAPQDHSTTQKRLLIVNAQELIHFCLGDVLGQIGLVKLEPAPRFGTTTAQACFPVTVALLHKE
jgi:hypothetical protein